MFKLLWLFWKMNKEDCGVYTVIFILLALITCVTWGDPAVYLAIILAVMNGWSLVSDFLKWRDYYGRIYSD